ncbi:EAL domain-containing protein [Pantoea ananatis]|uniref:EAL domain-containing protein n=1 Tax=Pantoea ananas TaxID=553 RepID=UPI0024AC9088|nr:EAL domain-containing protein [Pantoea ananatis]MDI6539116.1 EAL domain-containing protein [Pantoea ananatis]
MTTFILPHAVLPLGVQAFGRRWQLTPVLEPLWTPAGDLYALELLSRLHDAQTGDATGAAVFFTQAPRPEQQRVLAWQISLLTLLAPWCADRRVPVTLNLNRGLAAMLLAEPELGDDVRLLARWLRLEVSEDFLKAGAAPERDPLLAGLGRLAPLWLDDFGAGATGLAWLTGGHFEAVKLDRRLFTEFAGLPEGVAFMKALSALAAGLGVRTVAEGVADDALAAAAREADVDACQGWRWPAVTVSELGTLPARLPAAPRRSTP